MKKVAKTTTISATSINLFVQQSLDLKIRRMYILYEEKASKVSNIGICLRETLIATTDKANHSSMFQKRRLNYLDT